MQSWRRMRLVLLVMCALACGGACGCSGLPDWADPPRELGPGAGAAAAPVRLSHAWSNRENWRDIDVDPRTNAIYALPDVDYEPHEHRWTAVVHRIDVTGASIARYPLDGREPPYRLRVFRAGLIDNAIGFVAYAPPPGGGSVEVRSADGSLRWERILDGLMSIERADLDGDGVDELLMGAYRDGLVVMNARGRELWRNNKPGAVRAFFLPAEQDRPARIAADARVWWDAQGNPVPAWRVKGPVPSLMWAQSFRDPEGSYRIVQAEPARPGVELKVFDRDGALVWEGKDTGPDIGHARMSAVAVSRDGKWIAVVVKNGLVLIYDSRDGRRVTQVQTPSAVYPRLRWTTSVAGRPLLLAASAAGIFAYELLSDAGEQPVPQPAPVP